MRKITLWCIPGTFFLLACVLNWMGCIQGTDLADAVKPALLPLLCATSLAYLLGRAARATSSSCPRAMFSS